MERDRYDCNVLLHDLSTTQKELGGNGLGYVLKQAVLYIY